MSGLTFASRHSPTKKGSNCTSCSEPLWEQREIYSSKPLFIDTEPAFPGVISPSVSVKGHKGAKKPSFRVVLLLVIEPTLSP